MRPVRFEISKVMVWVAVIALNLAVFKALFSTHDLTLLVGGGLTWILLQVAARRAIRGDRRARFYWRGFIAGGLLASLSLIWFLAHRGSFIGSLWMAYLIRSERGIFVLVQWLAPSFRSGVLLEIIEILLMTMGTFMPIVFTAWAGGLLGRRIHDGMAGRPEVSIGNLAP